MNLTGDTISSITINIVPLKKPYFGRLQESTKILHTTSKYCVFERQPYAEVYMQLGSKWLTFGSHFEQSAGICHHTQECTHTQHSVCVSYTNQFHCTHMHTCTSTAFHVVRTVHTFCEHQLKTLQGCTCRPLVDIGQRGQHDMAVIFRFHFTGTM